MTKDVKLKGAKMFRRIRDLVENEGFDYYFRHYTSYEGENFDDPELKELWQAYTYAAERLSEYCGLED